MSPPAAANAVDTGNPRAASKSSMSQCRDGSTAPALRFQAGSVAVQAQGAGCGHGGVELAQRTGGGVAGVRVRPLPALALLVVHLLEPAPGHEDLASNLEPLGTGVAEELQGDLPDSADVRSDVLAAHPVAARRAAHESPALVQEADRESVDLHLADSSRPVLRALLAASRSRMRRSKARTSSSSKPLARDSIGT